MRGFAGPASPDGPATTGGGNEDTCVVEALVALLQSSSPALRQSVAGHQLTAPKALASAARAAHHARPVGSLALPIGPGAASPASNVGAHPGSHRITPASSTSCSSRRWACGHPLLAGGPQGTGVAPHHLGSDAGPLHVLRHPVGHLRAPPRSGLCSARRKPLLTARPYGHQLCSLSSGEGLTPSLLREG